MTTGYVTQILACEFAKQVLGPLFSDSITGREGLLNSVAHMKLQPRNVAMVDQLNNDYWVRDTNIIV